MGKPRSNKKATFELSEWRIKAGLDQCELANRIGFNHCQVSRIENKKTSLAGRGDIIIYWAVACNMNPFSPAVQRFLYKTGNAAFLPDHDCLECKRIIAQLFNMLALHRHHAIEPHHKAAISPEITRMVEEDICENLLLADPYKQPHTLYSQREGSWHDGITI